MFDKVLSMYTDHQLPGSVSPKRDMSDIDWHDTEKDAQNFLMIMYVRDWAQFNKSVPLILVEVPRLR